VSGNDHVGTRTDGHQPVQNAAPANERSARLTIARRRCRAAETAGRSESRRARCDRPGCFERFRQQSTGRKALARKLGYAKHGHAEIRLEEPKQIRNSQKNNADLAPSHRPTDTKNQGNTGSQSGANAQGDRDALAAAVRPRAHRDEGDDMRGPDIGLWFNRGNRDSL